jgi:hypothetical protein
MKKSRSQNRASRRREKLKAVLSFFLLAPEFWLLVSVLLHSSALIPHPSFMLLPQPLLF